MIIRYCKGCKEQINPKRLEILPTATTCVPCSTTQKRRCTLIRTRQAKADAPGICTRIRTNGAGI